MRTGIKTMTFAITHFSVAFLVGWVITGSFLMGSMIALIEPAVNTVAYAFHEKVWQRIDVRYDHGHLRLVYQ
jgi:uncharacterized membrane protein